ncbi:Bro-N domain-containing protein, partial [Endozoicomonas sp. SM1973]
MSVINTPIINEEINTFSHNAFGELRTVIKEGEPWFIAKDVAEILDYSVASAMTRHLDDDETRVSTRHMNGSPRDLIIINESGLYSAIFRSRKEEAKAFKKWVTREVLPSIRK